MYEAHFGLRERAFAETTEPSAYVPLPARDAALRRLRYGIEQGMGPVLAFGPPGSGKTLLARRLTGELGGRALHLTFPAMPAAELLAFLADELAEPSLASGSALAASVRRVRSALSAAASRGERTVLVVDEAHVIDDPATFEALRLLLNFSTRQTSDLTLVLVGAPELLLRLPASLADRLTARVLVGPFSESESAAYVEGRLRASGASRLLFDPDSLRRLHFASEGLPRRLNRLADLALLIAYARDRDQVDPVAIETAITELAPDGLAA
ncbi:MAG TPA: AAA family ATPase [Isosphaeraceae bacterium]|nr:AAA family ATPase [Isosphaeraceae bacterium]